MDGNETLQSKPTTRKEKKQAKKEAKRQKYQDAPALVRAWHMWLKYVVIVLGILALLFVGFVYVSYRYVMYEAQKFEETLVPVEAGDLISFTTKDLDGNEIRSEDLFRGHELTMLNVWATWCGPCKGELPELGKLAREFEAKNCQIVGICLDGDEEADTAKKLLEEAGAEYFNITAPENMLEVLPVTSIPTTYFVDSEGHVVGERIVGAYVNEYSKRLEELSQ